MTSALRQAPGALPIIPAQSLCGLLLYNNYVPSRSVTMSAFAIDTALSFGRVVKEQRRALGLTQDELARRVGCATVTIRKIEADDLRPSQQIAARLAMALAIPIDDRAAFVRLGRTTPPDDRSPVVTPTPPLAPQDIGLEDLSGRAIRGYELGERIGAGGFGAVYRAIQPLVEREIAIKI